MAEITSAKAMARTVRVSPRKTRLVLDLIRGKKTDKTGDSMLVQLSEID